MWRLLFGMRSLYVREEACSLSLCARLGMRQVACGRRRVGVLSLYSSVTNGGLACVWRRAISSHHLTHAHHVAEAHPPLPLVTARGMSQPHQKKNEDKKGIYPLVTALVREFARQ